jgi:hypothetical protein
MLQSTVTELALRARDIKDLGQDASYILTSAMIYACFADLKTKKPQIQLLDQLGQIIAAFPNSCQDFLSRWKTFLAKGVVAGGATTGNISILPLAVMYDLTVYVSEKTRRDQHPPPQAESYASLLHFLGTLESHDGGDYRIYPPSSRMVKILLKNGGNPNCRYFGSASPRERALMCVTRFRRDDQITSEEMECYVDILFSFIEAGANPNASIQIFPHHRRYSALELIDSSFLGLGSRNEELMDALRKRGARWEVNVSSDSIPRGKKRRRRA